MKKKKSGKDKEKQRILTPEFRVSFPHVFKPSAMAGAKPKFSITMLFPKKNDMSVLKQAIRHAKIAEFGPDSSQWPEDIASPVEDGDDPQYADREGYAGHYAIKASSNENARPGVVDYPNGDDITDPTEFYPGCFARAQVFARVWEFPIGSETYGVQFILDHVQKLKEGKAFGGRKSAKEAFGITAGAGNDDEGDDEEGF